MVLTVAKAPDFCSDFHHFHLCFR